MKKTKKLMAGVSATALTLSLAGCGSSNSSLPPKPTDKSCRDWDWSEEEGVWRCDESRSGYYGAYYYGGRYFNNISALNSDSSYINYKNSDSFKAAKKTLEAESVIARFDFIVHNGGYKCIEMNADTPTFIKELFVVNDQICQEFGMENPNAEMEELLKSNVRKSVAQSIFSPDAHIVFTAHDDNIEDYFTTLYIMQFVPGAKFTPLHQLHIQKGVGLFDEDGKRIDLLYRPTFPIENLMLDEDDAQNRIGLWLIELVELNLLTILNPPSAFLLQNKAVQAIIWGLHEEQNAFFTSEEHKWIAEYFLPTYLEDTPFIEKGLRYVKKPVFGREGDTVEIYDEDGQLIKEDHHKSYNHYPKVYQKFVEQPKTTFQSEKGVQTGELLVGSFLISGEAAAMGLRVGGMITNNLSYYLPIGMKRE